VITIKGWDAKLPGPCALAMGKFESIHMGHRALIDEMTGRAKEAGLPSVLMVFEPHPYRVLHDSGYKPLFSSNERAHLVEALGVDYLLEYPFDLKLSSLSAEGFCRQLYEWLQARIIVIGEKYRFGFKRGGNVDTLRHVGEKYKASVHEVAPKQMDKASKISTSTIRGLLSENKLPQAESLLGYPFFIMGKVTPGRKLGRTIEFPTINLYPPEEKFLLADGVYATGTIVDGRQYKGITNIGLRPTVEGANAPRSVETYLLDFEGGELYGKNIKTEFLDFIRPEQRFESLEALKAQIARDCKRVGH